MGPKRSAKTKTIPWHPPLETRRFPGQMMEREEIQYNLRCWRKLFPFSQHTATGPQLGASFRRVGKPFHDARFVWLLLSFRTSTLVQVSRTPRAAFEWRGTLPGVGEALKREIAGLVLVGQLWLWGFEGCGCAGCDWAGWLRGAFGGKRMHEFCEFLADLRSTSSVSSTFASSIS